MSSPTHSRHDADNIDAGKTAKFLANLQRTVGRRDPDDTPIGSSTSAPIATAAAPITKPPSLPVRAEISDMMPIQPSIPSITSPAEPTTSSIPISTRSQTAKSRRRISDAKGDRMQVEVTLDPGTASRVVYVRVDKTLADRLALIAFQNKINGAAGLATINDIGVAALNAWLDEYEQAA